MDINKWEKEYLSNEVIDCPHCRHNRPDHSCGNCYSEMSQQDCWQWKGYCTEKCLKYIEEELPKLRQAKNDAGIKCLCDNPQCAKCLAVNCQDDNCPVHTLKAKSSYRR